ncbi:hypothetical protein PZ897_03835 [Hoeflea sp. YIM 152468]|uniref:hypothetical protein n=1 Tax=Hoeflea sp. YIM 152468 TaxID=3031759 RepID=UPI0023DAF15C|nr:hypothetical protein [Hoeflea sp. YIM 152468]MDF1607302.1 hypothetical protein [Hoeflea sp. YIM 152468]
MKISSYRNIFTYAKLVDVHPDTRRTLTLFLADFSAFGQIIRGLFSSFFVPLLPGSTSPSPPPGVVLQTAPKSDWTQMAAPNSKKPRLLTTAFGQCGDSGPVAAFADQG